MDPIKVDFTKKGTSKKDIVIPPEKALLKIILSLVGSLIVAAVAYYIMLPPMNFKSTDMYLYFAIVIASYVIFLGLLSGLLSKAEYTPYVKRQAIVPGILIVVIGLVVGVGFIVSSVVLRANAFSKILPVNESGNFEEDIQEQNSETFKLIPRLDQDAAQALAQKALSSLLDSNAISQYTLSTTSTQINYHQAPTRAIPLQYASVIKWFTNRANGLPGYVIVNMATETFEYKKAPGGGIFYSPSEHFGRLLKRHLRFNYPTYMFDTPNFEIDEEGTPYWVCPYLDKSVGLFGGTDVLGVVLVDADDPNGASRDIPIKEVRENASLQWLDRVYSSDMLIEQYDYYGKYQRGFWNSIFGQRDMRITTEGHSYVALNDDVYLYTGVTSVTLGDDAIVGFIMINQRSKAATFYRVDGAKEDSARDAAVGRVQAEEYEATFPILINIGGQPTYFMGLKDKSKIRQQYALINVRQYNRIGANSRNVSECMSAYIGALHENGIPVKDLEVVDVLPDPNDPVTPADEPNLVEGTIKSIRTAVVNGNTQYFFLLDGTDTTHYAISASESELAILLNVGDRVRFSYTGAKSEVTRISKAEILPSAPPAAPPAANP